jgi:hypothetical protein
LHSRDTKGVVQRKQLLQKEWIDSLLQHSQTYPKRQHQTTMVPELWNRSARDTVGRHWYEAFTTDPK